MFTIPSPEQHREERTVPGPGSKEPLDYSYIGSKLASEVSIPGWSTVSIAKVFVLYWQCDGTLTKIQEQVLITKDGNANGNYRCLKKWIYFFPGLMAVSAVVPIGFIGWNVKNAIEDLWGRDYTKLMFVVIIRYLCILHGWFVGHIPLYIFMITMGSLLIEFEESKRKFKEFFQSIKSPTDDQRNVEGFLTLTKAHYFLVEKVQKADRIFRVFTFVMIALWLPTTIFTPAALLYSKWSSNASIQLYDAALSILHFYGLCVMPAKVYTQLHRTTTILNNEICKNVGSSLHSQSLISLAKTFAESLAHTNSGITVGGMVLIRKSMILTCLSLVVPYMFFQSIKSPTDDQRNIEGFLSLTKAHYFLVEKVQKADRIFRVFTFVMIALWLPTTIFTPAALLYSKWSSNASIQLYDAALSILHFYGLCVMPAKVYTQLHRTTIILNNEICKNVGSSLHSQSLISLAKTFAEGLAHTNSGITVGGMVLIRKSMILTCLSLVVPYMVLFLQLRFGAMNSHY